MAHNDDGRPFLFLDKMQVKPPIKTNSVRHFNPTVIRDDAATTRIIVHRRYPSLAENFLKHKLQHGSQHEQELYRNLTWQGLTSRLIEKRALVFMGGHDHTVLRNGRRIQHETQQWDRNGSEEQHLNSDLTLREYLSYDEIMLGSLIGVSSPSYFINSGSRNNWGRSGATFEPRGIIMGLVGARFERNDRMDSIFILPPVKNPRQHPDLTKTFIDFFGAKRHPETGFDADMYTARIRITADILLLEANARAADKTQRAYVYVVGLGLGVWQHDSSQNDLYVSTFADAISSLSLPHVSTIEFGWVSCSPIVQSAAIKAGDTKVIEVKFTRRDPAGYRADRYRNELLVSSYAWDGNAFPGNEYWQGSLAGSGDSAAACMSTIGEVHNPVVNPAFLQKVQVVGEEVSAS
ncbi:hypothetical protein DOTSEDRAFT_79310 [Dothistroma septosporum NZE10]|uniref:Uncharacterized protein n=1 Tax=Dothistroma septosporum (strain NZE10 / CBS 128990) TaxID=675120 RepID=N1PS59_DOTSN|nr:hypothetical protein DOTSEDRAFT_79310 [Dothistroma septosporum NZE10]